jgi:hypothetical protein
MNLSLGRFLYGILGAFLGACSALGISLHFIGHLNIKVIIIVSAVSFFVSFCWWEYIIKFWTNLSSSDPPLKHQSSKKEKNHERRN